VNADGTFLPVDSLATRVNIRNRSYICRMEKGSNGNFSMKEIPGATEVIQADLVLLAMGFLHPVHDGLLNKLGLELDTRQNIKVNGDFLTSNPKIFAAGDAKDGASLVVKAIYSEGRQQTRSIDISGIRKISRSEGKREGGKEGWRDGETEGKRERARGRRGEG